MPSRPTNRRAASIRRSFCRFSARPERLLNRSLFYTAVTRARQLLVLVGSEATVEKMVLSDKKTRRYSALRRRIRQRCGDD